MWKKLFRKTLFFFFLLFPLIIIGQSNNVMKKLLEAENLIETAYDKGGYERAYPEMEISIRCLNEARSIFRKGLNNMTPSEIELAQRLIDKSIEFSIKAAVKADKFAEAYEYGPTGEHSRHGELLATGSPPDPLYVTAHAEVKINRTCLEYFQYPDEIPYRGYGLYSILLFNNYIDDENFRHKTRLIIQTLYRQTNIYSKPESKSFINALYIPLKKMPSKTLNEKDAINWICEQYDYKYAATIMEELKLKKVQHCIFTCEGFCKSWERNEKKYLLWNLDYVLDNNEIPIFVNAYLEQVKRPMWNEIWQINDPARIIPHIRNCFASAGYAFSNLDFKGLVTLSSSVAQ